MSKPMVCIVCGNNSIDNFNSTYHKFPTCPLKRDKWIHLLNLDKNNLKSRSRVCQRHFPKSQIVRIKLIKNAMPKNVRKEDNSQLFPNPDINIGWVVNGNVNFDTGINERILQAKANVSVEDDGMEKEVICNNKSMRGGHKPPGELCLICAQLPDPLETNQPPLATDRMSSFLNPHLWSMFVLKLLNFPKEECENVFIETFGVNPGEWFRLCGPCFQIVEQAFTLEQEVAKLQKKLERVKSNVTTKLEESLNQDKSAKKKSQGVFDISEYIRQVFKENFRTELADPTPTSVSAIKSEDDNTDVYDNCPKSPNSTTISQCNNDNITVKVENCVESEIDDSLFDADAGDNDNMEIIRNDTSTEYNSSKHVNLERKLANKLKRTALKRCRGSEIEEQNPPMNSRNTDAIPRANPILPTRLTCSLCPAKFIRNSNLKKHLDLHKKYKETSCPKCNFPCITPEKLKRHLTLKRCTFQGQGSSMLALSSASHDNHEKCHICGRIYPTHIQMAKHLRIHYRHKSTQCPVCKLPCINKKKLANHLKICRFAVTSSNGTRGQVEEFKCDLCSYTTDYPNMFSKHRRTHEQAKFNCELCYFPTLTRAWLKTHMKEAHEFVLETPTGRSTNRRGPGVKKSRDEPVSCHLCPAIFPSIQKVNKHVRNVHEKSYPCSECGRIYESQSQLQNHLLEKHGIEKTMLICDICGMQFTEHAALYKHTKKFHLSSKDKPKAGDEATVGVNEVSKYERKCPHCEVCCCNMKALKIHLRANHPELYKHKCELCPMTYISSGNLKIHMKNIHLKEEVECSKCKAKMRGCSMRGHLKLFCRFRLQADDINATKIISG